MSESAPVIEMPNVPDTPVIQAPEASAPAVPEAPEIIRRSASAPEIAPDIIVVPKNAVDSMTPWLIAGIALGAICVVAYIIYKKREPAPIRAVEAPAPQVN